MHLTTPSEGERGAAPARGFMVQDYDAQFAAATTDALDLAGELNDGQGEWRAMPNQWSIAECLAHLAATGRVYLPAIEDAVRHGRAAGRTAPGPFRPSFVGRWLISSMEPPPRRTMRTQSTIMPADRVSLADSIRDFTTVQDALRLQIGEAAELDLERVRLRSPLMPLLRLSLTTCFGFLAAHERRHLWQARRVHAAPNFPAT